MQVLRISDLHLKLHLFEMNVDRSMSIFSKMRKRWCPSVATSSSLMTCGCWSDLRREISRRAVEGMPPDSQLITFIATGVFLTVSRPS